MKAIELLKELAQANCVLVPFELVNAVANAAEAVGLPVRGGAYHEDERGESVGQYLYLDR